MALLDACAWAAASGGDPVAALQALLDGSGDGGGVELVAPDAVGGAPAAPAAFALAAPAGAALERVALVSSARTVEAYALPGDGGDEEYAGSARGAPVEGSDPPLFEASLKLPPGVRRVRLRLLSTRPPRARRVRVRSLGADAAACADERGGVGADASGEPDIGALLASVQLVGGAGIPAREDEQERGPPSADGRRAAAGPGGAGGLADGLGALQGMLRALQSAPPPAARSAPARADGNVFEAIAALSARLDAHAAAADARLARLEESVGARLAAVEASLGRLLERSGDAPAANGTGATD